MVQSQKRSSGFVSGETITPEVRRWDDTGEASLGTIVKLGAAALSGAIVYTAIFGAGYIKGSLMPRAEIETVMEIEDPGWAEVKEIDLEIEETPIVGFTAGVEGSKSTLTKEATIGIPAIAQFSFEAEKTTLELAVDVDTNIEYNASLVDVSYEQNKIVDPGDDRLVLRVPLEAFSTSASLVPMTEKTVVSEDARSIFTNLTGAWTKSFTFLRSVPGLGALAEQDMTGEQVLKNISAVNALENVQKQCTPEVFANQHVNTTIHDIIARDAIQAVVDSDITEFDELTVGQLRNMETVVYIGDEDEATPRNLSQAINFRSKYADVLERAQKDTGIELGSPEAFECSLGSDVRKHLAESSQTTPSGKTLRSQEERR